MSKKKSSDDFLHHHNKADGKKYVYGVRNTQVLNAKTDLSVSTNTQQKSVIQSDRKFSYIEIFLAIRQHGCVCAKAVKKVMMDFWGFSPMKVMIWLMLGLQKPLQKIDFSVTPTLGSSPFEMFFEESKRFISHTSKTVYGCREISYWESGIATKYQGFLCFSTQHHST